MKLWIAITVASAFSGLASAAALTPNQDSDITITPNVDVNVDFDATKVPTLSPRLVPWGNIAGLPIADLDKSGDIPAQIAAYKAKHGDKGRRSEDAETDGQEDYDDSNDQEEYYNSDIVLTERDLEEQWNNATEHEGRDIQERAYDYNNIYCNVKWPECSLNQARARRTSLYPKGKGRPYLEGGPGKCSRVACAYNAAIVFCNDNKYPLTLSSWKVIADGADKIFNKCGHTNFGHSATVHGQAFHAGNFNVIVRKEKC
ncbi:uncharacterized protein BDV14DRAFT_179211 [Aspergillus stella-maris]|uniref:uncharacterized protein n=1 Tax=Aspergillus stella-maris TaxID=1810926 RepID=UPI003CCC9763